MVFGTNYPSWNFRVIAGTAGGDDVLGLAGASVTNGSAATKTYIFPSIAKLDGVQNFQVKAQPMGWIEFSHLRLVASNRVNRH